MWSERHSGKFFFFSVFFYKKRLGKDLKKRAYKEFLFKFEIKMNCYKNKTSNKSSLNTKTIRIGVLRYFFSIFRIKS